MKTQKKRKKITIRDVVKAAHEVGCEIKLSLDPKEMPRRFPNDPEPVRLLIEESERISALGNRWLKATIPNQIAAQACLTSGWAYSLAAAWLRCKLNGELLPECEKKAP